MNRKNLLAAACLALPALVACEGSVPQVKQHQAVVPSLTPNTAVQALDAPSSEDADAEAMSGECEEWVEVSSTYDEAAGTFASEYACTAGGAIERTTTEGQGDMMGNGSYTQTYFLRDGSEIVWSYTYTSDQVSTTYVGTSSEGDTYEGTYTYLDMDTTQVHEVYTTADGIYTTDGISANDGSSFDGSTAFDDPNTAASPDYVYENTQQDDGSYSQVVQSAGDGWTSSYTATFEVDGSFDYQFQTDLTETVVAPDYAGSYGYAADGSGEGEYTQSYDDGSSLLVSHVIAADGSYDESWTFDDAATDQGVDQEGSIHYAADGTGSGTITTHVVNGDDEICAVSVSADGTSSVDDCE
jgi:hypothetical protein